MPAARSGSTTSDNSLSVLLPIARVEPSCFCGVDGCECTTWYINVHSIGGANIAVGDEAASCELKASYAELRRGPAEMTRPGLFRFLRTYSASLIAQSIGEHGADSPKIFSEVHPVRQENRPLDLLRCLVDRVLRRGF